VRIFLTKRLRSILNSTLLEIIYRRKPPEYKAGILQSYRPFQQFLASALSWKKNQKLSILQNKGTSQYQTLSLVEAKLNQVAHWPVYFLFSLRREQASLAVRWNMTRALPVSSLNRGEFRNQHFNMHQIGFRGRPLSEVNTLFTKKFELYSISFFIVTLKRGFTQENAKIFWTIYKYNIVTLDTQLIQTHAKTTTHWGVWFHHEISTW